MSFQIHALPETLFGTLFDLSDEELARHSARRAVVEAKPGTPCRVSLADAEIGETVILLNYAHQPHATPYRSTHAIFVREGAKRAHPRPGEVPDALGIRLLSVRAFDGAHDMITADVVDGRGLAGAIEAMFEDPAVAYLHLHYAKAGRFAAGVTRA